MSGLVLALIILGGTLFDDPVSCTVLGHVYRMHEADPVQFARADACPGVKVETDGNALVLHSPTIWVMILVPAEYGHNLEMALSAFKAKGPSRLTEDLEELRESRRMT
jgi:hypothetical protein